MLRNYLFQNTCNYDVRLRGKVINREMYFYVYDTGNAAVTRDAIIGISGSGNPKIGSVTLADSMRSRNTPVQFVASVVIRKRVSLSK